MHATKWIILSVTLHLAGGCGGTKKNNEFMDFIRAYNDGVRWRNAETSAAHIPVRERADFLEERAEVDEDLRIGDYEILRVAINKDTDKASINVEYQWHLDSRGIVHKTVTQQLWEKSGDNWLMVEEWRLRGEPMPGVPEPEPKSDPKETPEKTPVSTANTRKSG